MKPLDALTYLMSRIDSYYGHYGEDEFFEETIEAFNTLRPILEDYSKLNKLIKDNCIGFNLRQVVEKGLYQIYLEQMCDIMCPEIEDGEYEDFE